MHFRILTIKLKCNVGDGDDDDDDEYRENNDVFEFSRIK